MASPTIQQAIFTPDPPVSGQAFTLRIVAHDPDTVVLSYNLTVTDLQNNVTASAVASAPLDELSYAASAADQNSPPLTQDANDPALFHGIAP